MHAFLVTAYKDEAQLCRLITQLLKYNSQVYLHIDKKSAELRKSMEMKFTAHARVSFIKNPVKVYWGGFSHLKAILALLKLAHTDPGNQRFHLLSGQDLPIRSGNEFDLFFRTNTKKEYISCFKLPDKRWKNGGLDRMNYFHLNDIFDPKKYIFPRLNGRLQRLQARLGLKRKQPSYIRSYYGGGTWWSISRNAVDEIFHFMKSHPDFTGYFKHAYCPEEIFFQTILTHSALEDAIIGEDLRYIDWSEPGGKFPPVLNDSYLEKMYEGENFFARKFDSGISESLRKRLEELVDGK